MRHLVFLTLALSLSAGAQRIVHSFDGDKGVEFSACQPDKTRCGRQPEMNVAANGSAVVQVTWQDVQVYDYNGKLLRSTPFSDFVRKAGLDPNPPDNKGPFEPHVVFDEFINRWIITVTCKNDCVLVSAGADPQGAWGGVNLTCLQGGPCLNRDPALHIGYDKNGLYYCGGHLGEEHPKTVPTVAYDCFAVPTAEVAKISSGTAPEHINRVHSMPLDILPAIDHDPKKSPSAPEFFAAKTCARDKPSACQRSENFPFEWIVETFTWSVSENKQKTGTTGTGAYSLGTSEQLVKTGIGSKEDKWLYNLPCCNGDLASLSQAGNSEIGLRAAESHRLINLVEFAGHLYGALGSGPCTHDCGAQGTDTNNLMFYVDMDCTKTNTCVVSQTAKISGADFSPVYGTTGVDSHGNVGILAASSTSSTDLSVLLWTRKKTDPPNTFSGPITVVKGTQPYTCLNRNNLALIGNAVGLLTVRDPKDGTKLWTTQQWSNDATRCVWNTRIIEYEIK